MRSLIVSLVVLASLALVGCGGSKEAQLAGTYSGEIQLSAEAAKNPVASNMVKEMFGTPTLTLNADKKFSLQMKQGKAEGTWTLTGDKVSLKSDTVDGKPVAEAKKKMQEMGAPKENLEQMDKTSDFNVSSDMKTLTAIPINDEGAKFGKLVFTKKG
jgi:hypothetical protein